MMRSSISISSWICALLLLSAPALSSAAPVAPKAEGKLDATAEELYRKGVAQYKAEQYADAVVSFESAYRISQAPRLLYNLGTAHRKLGHLQDAIDFFDEYLKREPNIEPDRRSTVEGFLVELREEQRKRAAAHVSPATPQPTPAPAPAEQPLVRKWWFWTAIGGTAVVTGLGIGLGIGLQPKQTQLPNYYDPTF